MNYTHIFWDFNGTILDDVKTGIDCVNELLEQRGLAVISDKDYYRRVFGFPVIDYYKRLGFDFEKEDYHNIAVRWVELYMEKVKTARLNDGVKKCLDYIKGLGVPQYILSATQKDMLIKQLDMLGIADYFEKVTGLDNIYAGSKTELGKQLAKSIQPQKALVIGDTTHDYETAAGMGADCILFTGGHMNKQTLSQCHCPLFDSFTELDMDKLMGVC